MTRTRDPLKPNLRYLVKTDWSQGQQGIITQVGWLQTDPAKRVELQVQGGAGRLKISIHGVPVLEQQVPADISAALLRECRLKLTKTRYLHASEPFEQDRHTGRWLIDVYEAPLINGDGTPLTIARLQGAPPQTLPHILTEDISSDPRYQGSWLMCHGMPKPGERAYRVTLRSPARHLLPEVRPEHVGGDTELCTHIDLSAPSEGDALTRANRRAAHGCWIWHPTDALTPEHGHVLQLLIG